MNRYGNFKSGYNPFELSYYEELKKNQELRLEIIGLESDLEDAQEEIDQLMGLIQKLEDNE